MQLKRANFFLCCYHLSPVFGSGNNNSMNSSENFRLGLSIWLKKQLHAISWRNHYASFSVFDYINDVRMYVCVWFCVDRVICFVSFMSPFSLGLGPFCY